MNFTRNLTQDLTHKLGVMIIKGEYPVNQRMPSEAVLCEQFSVSRSATREAVKMLAAKGLISSRPKQGITVLPESQSNLFDTDVLSWILQSKPSLSLLKEFTQVRYAIEPVAAQLAARHVTSEQLSILNDNLQRIADAHHGLDDVLEAHIDFLNTILLASGNRFFIQLTQFVKAALKVSIRYTNQVKGVNYNDISFHTKLYSAIAQGEDVLAYQLVEEILLDDLRIIEANI